MIEQEWRGIRPSTLEGYMSWPDGPWKDEPDRAQFKCPVSSLPGLIIRTPSLGNLNGYVGVGSDHPLYGMDYDALYEVADMNGLSVNAHGGITYTGKGHAYVTAKGGPRDDLFNINLVSEEGESPQDLWFFGFDTAHAGDIWPAHVAMMQDPRFSLSLSEDYPHDPFEGSEYRTFDYVKAEVLRLAEALHKVALFYVS